jgi:starch synthase
VSSAYAEEIKTAERGCGLDGVFRERAKDLVGILNGADYEIWKPETDPFISRTYGFHNLLGKKSCKSDLQKIFGLHGDPDIPLIGMVSRLTSQKGFDLLEKAMDDLLSRDVQFVLLGTGDTSYEQIFSQMTERYPGRVAVQIAFDEAMAHKVTAGSDLLLMPSLYEPGGLTQIYSLRYGTIPIVRATGGLKDTIKEFEPKTGEGNGFVFGPYDVPAFLVALDRALDLLRQKKEWSKLMGNAMAADFSWAHSARSYADLYHKLVGHPSA